MRWLIDEVNTSNEFLQVRDPASNFVAVVSEDGSLHLNEGKSYFKIKNLEEFIERLQELKEYAKKHFGEWPK